MSDIHNWVCFRQELWKRKEKYKTQPYPVLRKVCKLKPYFIFCEYVLMEFPMLKKKLNMAE